MESMMTTMAPASFYYYNPDPSPEARQHGHFIPHPQQHQMQMYPVVPTLPSTPVYSRPNSSCSQQPLPMKAFTSVPAHMMTPMPSPPAQSAAIVTSSTVLSHPVAHKPAIMLETEFCDADGLRYPSTPPLSTTSSISSPGSCDMLATPLNPMFSGLDSFDGLKENCVNDAVSDKLAIAGWSNCSSPPLTPVYIHSQVPSKTAPSKQVSASVSSDLLSVSACPSLSPSPSPYPHSEQDNDFCDPRNLTVSCADGALSPEFSALSSLCAEDEFVKPESLAADAQASVLSGADFDQSLTSNLLEDFPELESEDDFLNGLVNLAGSPVSSATTPASGDMSSRSRASSSVSSAHSEFECGEFFNTTTWESSAVPSEAEHPNKRQRTASGSIPTMTSVADTASGKTESVSSNEDAASVSDNNATNSVSSGSPSNTGNDMSAMPAPTSRRGRKQSLTEDPSKIFACDLCNRRFRRQEHLKRHYRSLHTQEKPFSCHECGKKFSRSDNLAQHARTHGAGAFVMNLYDDPEIVAAATGYPPHAMYAPHAMSMAEDYANMGRVLFQVAAEVPGSGSDLSSDDNDAQGKKKRKRMD